MAAGCVCSRRSRMLKTGRRMGNSCLDTVLAEQPQHMQFVKMWESGYLSALSRVKAGHSRGPPSLQVGSACIFKPTPASSPCLQPTSSPGSWWRLHPRNIQDQAGQGSEQTAVVEDVSSHCKGIRLDDF